MNSIVIFGAGNVATHLFKAITTSTNYQVVQVFNHQQKSLERFKKLVATTTSFKEVIPADIYILALKDDAIQIVAKQIEYKDALVMHTSGATSIEVLKEFKNHGVLYPLQTFSKSKPVEFKTVPVCIEGVDEQQLLRIENFAGTFTNKIYRITSQQRKSLHVAAVFVSNFVNFLYTQGEELCKENNIPFEILHPLIEETASKIKYMSPLDAQTGPARRNDFEVIQGHLKILNDEQNKIYTLLTQSIQNLHGKEL